MKPLFPPLFPDAGTLRMVRARENNRNCWDSLGFMLIHWFAGCLLQETPIFFNGQNHGFL